MVRTDAIATSASRRFAFGLLAWMLVALAAVPMTARAGWQLVWSDEFTGSAINTSLWKYEIGYIRNNELQYYTNRTENARLEDGVLIIETHKEPYSGYAYTSGSINTKGTRSYQYGRFEMRAKLPYGKGIWPAFWAMGDKGGWPSCGEIDVMEMIGGGEGRDDKTYGTLHWDDGGHKSSGHNLQLPAEEGNFCDAYHTWAFEWDAAQARWYMDGKMWAANDITSAAMSEFHQKNWILLNLAVGGSWPGAPDANTVFPQKYCIDYVRVYQSSAEKNHLVTPLALVGGSISPGDAQLVAEGADQSFTFTPDPGYEVTDLMVDGVVVTGTPSTYTFSNVTAEHRIRVSFGVATGLADGARFGVARSRQSAGWAQAEVYDLRGASIGRASPSRLRPGAATAGPGVVVTAGVGRGGHTILLAR